MCRGKTSMAAADNNYFSRLQVGSGNFYEAILLYFDILM